MLTPRPQTPGATQRLPALGSAPELPIRDLRVSESDFQCGSTGRLVYLHQVHAHSRRRNQCLRMPAVKRVNSSHCFTGAFNP